MKKFSIIIAAILLVSMQFMMSSVFAESEDFEERFLESLGIITIDETYKSDAEISRIEFVKAVLKMKKTNTEDFVLTNMQPFFDVTENDEFFNTANIAYKLGLIRGGEDGCFRPYAGIRPDEATTILLRALCGENALNAIGGASELSYTLGLYDDLDLNGAQACTYEDAALLIYNALNASVVKRELDGSYKIDENDSLLLDLYEIEETEGIIDANYKKSIYDKPLDYNFISIDGEVYKVRDEKYNDLYFGQNVIVYYTENSKEEYEIVYMEADDNYVTEVDFEDVDLIDSKALKYIKPGSKKVIGEDLSKSCITIHNGSRINLTKSFDASGNGYVTAIDNDDDGYIDILDITTYDILVVKNVNTIYDRMQFENSDYIIEFKDYGDVRIVDEYGKKVELSSVLRYNVVKISASSDREYLTVTVLTDKISVVVAGVREDPDKNIFIITADDGTEYKTIRGFNEGLRTGVTYNFAVDSKGNICAKISEVSSGYKIGCVMKTSVSADTGIGFIKLMGIDEKISKLIIPEKVTCLNYNKRFLVSEAIDIMNESYIIRYSEKDGVMTSFEVASDDENYQGLQKMTELPTGNNAYTRYWKNAMIIGGRIPLDANTVIMRQDDSKSPSDESAYSFNSVSDLSNASYYPSSIAYRIGNAEFCADVILIKQKDVLNKYSPIMLISSVSERYDVGMGEKRTIIKGFVNNAETEVLLSEENLVTYTTAQGTEIKLGVGDCIRYGVNKKGEVILVKLIFDYSEMQMYGNNDGNDLGTAYGVEELHRTGVVEYIRDDYVKIIADGLTAQEDYLCSLKDGGVYQVSVRDGKVVCETISAFDIDSLEKNPDLKDKVFVRMHNGLTGVFIVYKAN